MKINNSIVLKVLIVGILIGALMTNLIYAFLPIEFVDYSNLSYLRRYLGKISDVEDDVVVEAITTTSTSLTTSSSTSSTTIPTSTTTTSSTSSSTTSTTTTSTSSSTTTTSSTSSTTVSTTSTTLGGNNFVDSFGSVVINEVMYDPKKDANEEFVEVYNTENFSVNMSGWMIRDNEHIDNIFAFGNGTAIIPSHSFAVITDKDTGLELEGIVHLSVDDHAIGNGLSNSGDNLTLLKKNYSDFMSYSGGGKQGYSLEWDGELWNESLVEGGTPGSKNSVS